jgi:acyl transferase domain-containing protein
MLGRCHTFDERADGYCRGEGCSAFLLVVSGGESSTTLRTSVVVDTAVQQDGPSASLTAPNGSSQRRLLDTVQH